MTLSNDKIRPGGRLDELNPYRIGMRLILDRLSWDLSPIAWTQRKKFKALHNGHVGEKAVILCNGPSLLDVDFSSLEGVFTFGLNKINLLFDKTSFRPSLIAAVNPLVIEQNAAFFAETQIPLFLDSVALKLGIPPRKNVSFLHTSDFPYFSRDCSFSVFQGFTVTYVALQLAFHMGFSKVALVGCDHDFQIPGNPNQITYNSAQDASHFCGNYFAPNQPWQYPDLKSSELYYDLARRCYEVDGRMIVNSSTHTKLNDFPLMRLEDFLHDN
jgi:hypothetical protein